MIIAKVLAVTVLLVVFVQSKGQTSIPDSEYTALEDFYNSTSGESWKWRNETTDGPVWFENAYPCDEPSWQGLTCVCTGQACNIQEIQLKAYQLSGTIPSSISNFTMLERLELGENDLYETIPHNLYNMTNLIHLSLQENSLTGTLSDSVGNLQLLIELRLGTNKLIGTLPASLASLNQLQVIELFQNRLDGTIPIGIYEMKSLVNLSLSSNHLSGSIPPVIGTMQNLKVLSLYGNKLNSSIPYTIGALTQLDTFLISLNNITGVIPESLYSLVNLKLLNMDNNQLSGTLSSSLGALTELIYFQASNNAFHGTIPESIGNCTKMLFLDLSNNHLQGTLPDGLFASERLLGLYLNSNYLTGTIPSSIGRLVVLFLFNINVNDLTGSLPEEVQYMKNLATFDAGYNYLNGTIPDSFYSLTELVDWDLGHNAFSGTISEQISNVPLERLNFAYNNLVGTLPQSLYSCTRLVYLYLSNNHFTGTLSSDLGYLTNLQRLFLDGNHLEGTIPSTIQELTGLQELVLGYNKFNGTVPLVIYDLTDLTILTLYANKHTGSISDKISKLTKLTYLSLGANLLRGRIPEVFGNMVKLQTLDLDSNKLQGTIPAILGNITELKYLELYNNLLTGTIPDTIGQLVNLQFLDLQSNELHGTIPIGIFRLYSMVNILLYDNNLSGSVPSEVGNLTSLTYFDVSLNRMTGTIPSSLGNLDVLLSLYLYNNSMTGTLPDSLCSCRILTEMYFENNFFSGTIPECYFAIQDLTVLTMFNNSLSGTIARNISIPALSNVELSINQLTGQLPDITSNVLQIFELTSNQFTGTINANLFRSKSTYQQVQLGSNLFIGGIPSSLSELKYLNYLDLSSNVLTGTVPSELSHLVSLVKLFLNKNGLSGVVNCFNSTAQRSLTNVELSNNQFTGTLPAQVFRSTSLQTFAAVSNCFTGSLPVDVCSATGLTALALDGLHTASSCRIELIPYSKSYTLNYFLPGSIPACVFSLPSLTTLHVTGNGMQGSLSPSLSIGSLLNDLALSYNQLTGLVPNAITYKSFNSLDVSFNRLSGILPNNLVPGPNNGSVFLEVNRLSGNIPLALKYIKDISILNGNLFTCDYQRTTLPVHDSEYLFYQCGTSEMEQAIYAWIILAGLTLGFAGMILFVHRLYADDNRGYYWIDLGNAFYDKMQEWRKIFHNKEKDYSLPNVRLFGKFCTSLRRAFLRITIFILVVVMPISLAISVNFSMYQYQYAWNVSSVLLTGITPAMTMLSILIVFLCFAFGTFYTNLVNFRTVKLHDQGRSVGRVLSSDVHMVELRPTMESVLSADTTNTHEHSVDSANTEVSSKLKEATKSNYKLYGSLCAVALFNFIFVLTVNVVYVRITTKYSPVVVAFSQLLLSSFKLMWNDYAIRNLTLYAHNYSTKSAVLTSYEERALEGKYMSFNTYTLIFNIIVIPWLATAAVSSDCFYDVLFPSANIESSYSYTTCATLGNTVQLRLNNCTQFVEVTTTTSYTPPFVYRYQCSSTLVTTYAVLYVYNFMIAAFGQPLAMISLTWLCKYLNPKSRLFKALQWFVPRLYRTDTVIRSDKTRIFHKDRFNLRMAMYLSVFMTYGVVFPPLAVIICLAVFVQSYFTQLSIGRRLGGLTIEMENDLKILKIFDYDCANTGDIFKQTVVYVGPIAGLFYAFLVFDTYGDAVGAVHASWALLVMFAVGCLISVVYVVAVKKEPPKAITTRESVVIDRRDISEIIFTRSMIHSDSVSEDLPPRHSPVNAVTSSIQQSTGRAKLQPLQQQTQCEEILNSKELQNESDL